MAPRRSFPRWTAVVVSLALAGALATAPLSASSVPSSGSATSAGPFELRRELLRLVNGTRVTHDVSPLRLDASLSREALEHSKRMARAERLFPKPGLAELIREHGGTTFGENLAKGRNLRRIVNVWLRRPDTRPNLLGSRFRHAGIGIARAGGLYWVTFWPYA